MPYKLTIGEGCEESGVDARGGGAALVRRDEARCADADAAQANIRATASSRRIGVESLRCPAWM